MSAPFSDALTFAPLAVLGASLVGSGHCVAMCGGLVSAAASSRSEVLRFHLGRGLGYASLGAVAGLLGKGLLQASALQPFSWAVGLIFGLSFLFMGVRVWLGRPVHFFTLPNSVSANLNRFAIRAPLFRSFLMGTLTSFLPCGWLQTFVLGAVATQSALWGAVYLTAFWLGTIPALSFAPWLVRKLLKPLSIAAPRFSAILLILIGVASIGMKLKNSSPSHSCHDSGSAVISGSAETDADTDTDADAESDTDAGSAEAGQRGGDSPRTP